MTPDAKIHIRLSITGILHVQVSAEHWSLKRLQGMVGGPALGLHGHLEWDHDQLTRAALTESRIWDRETAFKILSAEPAKEDLQNIQSIVA